MKSQTAIIQLGRYGDIINILPLCKMMADMDAQPVTVFTLPEYSDILDGVSYARHGHMDVTGLKHWQIEETLKKSFPRVMDTTVGGFGLAYERQCDSFTKEAWRRSGMLAFRGLESLHFDQRSEEREKVLCEKYLEHEKKPTLLVNLSGTSSPYPYADELWQHLRAMVGDEFHLLNLASFRAHRIYDLLGLYEHEKVAGLLTIDTATLHLAAAADGLQTIGLIADTPTLWHGANTGNLLAIRYRESIHSLDQIVRWFSYRQYPNRHLYCEYKTNDSDTRRRMRIARETWDKTYMVGIRPLPFYDAQAPRLFDDGKRRLPFLRDMLDLAFHGNIDTSFVLLSNSDTCFASQSGSALPGTLWWASRRDFARIEKPLTFDEVNEGDEYPGTDMFGIPFEWWEENRNVLPDLLFGAEGWDCCLRELMRVTGGQEIKNCCYHERHDSVWERPENRYTLPSQVHNRTLARKFLISLNIDPRPHGL